MSRGQALEKNLEELITSFFTPSYWPSRSGTQNGFDAFARFKIEDTEYVWKLECKDLNGRNHSIDYNSIVDIEVSDFSDKILQTMALSDPCFPHVFCLFIPHKKIGNNNTLRDNLSSWNYQNKFPFKILIWDFEFLKDILPCINNQCVDNIYPNSPSKNKEKHDQAIEHIRQEIKKESFEGYFYNRSYIKERQAKKTVLEDNSLQIIINSDIQEDRIPRIKFSIGDAEFIYDEGKVIENRIKYFPTSTSTEGGGSMSVLEKPETTIAVLSESKSEVFDIAKYNEEARKKKIELIKLFEEQQNQSTLYQKIQDFCNSHDEGVISFICNRDIGIAGLPLKEMTSADFDSASDIRFYFEFKDQQ
jgi:hypothetical protein